MKSESVAHYPVLHAAVLEHLAPQEGEILLDCTMGRGGHAIILSQHLGTTGRYIGLDCDDEAIAYCRQKLCSKSTKDGSVQNIPCQVDIIKSNFSDAVRVLDNLGLKQRGVDIMFADLGISSAQLGDADRGISFQLDGPLDMRLDPSLPNTAADLVNQLPEEQLAAILFYFGEEKLSRRIAKKIVEEREGSGSLRPILTTSQLACIVSSAIPAKVRQQSNIHPATKTFMALRIAVNQELAVLNKLLKIIPQLLSPGGRAGIITFHSLEDRLVKDGFIKLQNQQMNDNQAKLEIVTKKPILPSIQELKLNPRSRSAKFRIIRKQSLDEIGQDEDDEDDEENEEQDNEDKNDNDEQEDEQDEEEKEEDKQYLNDNEDEEQDKNDTKQDNQFQNQNNEEQLNKQNESQCGLNQKQNEKQNEEEKDKTDNNENTIKDNNNQLIQTDSNDQSTTIHTSTSSKPEFMLHPLQIDLEQLFFASGNFQNKGKRGRRRMNQQQTGNIDEDNNEQIESDSDRSNEDDDQQQYRDQYDSQSRNSKWWSNEEYQGRGRGQSYKGRKICNTRSRGGNQKKRK